MKPINYTYLDDEPREAVRPYVRAVTGAVQGLAIEHIPPMPYPQQIKWLRERHQEGLLDGLILDLRLDQFPDREGGHGKADYRAATLAQEIRTRATEGNLPEFPIVLWSTDERLKQSYVNDDTSHDLFDLKSLKGTLEEPEGAEEVGSQLRALVEGYLEIRAARTKSRGRNRGVRLLGFSELPSFVDERILAHFQARDGAMPTHEVARFILRQLLDTPGPLIDASVLAARLGIDLAQSPGFRRLVDASFSEAAYVGPFHNGWSRWWAAEIERLWNAMKDVPGPLRITPADARVSFLQKRSKVKDVVAATLPEHARSTTFWTRCEATGMPLDPKEGFLSDKQPPYSWQDRAYLSLNSLIDGTAKEKGFRIDPLEAERLARIRRGMMRK